MKCAYENKDLIFLLNIDINNKNSYCEQCFFQLLSDEFAQTLKSSNTNKLELQNSIFNKLELNQNQYGVYHKITKKWEIIDIFPVPGCKGLKHEVTYS